MRYCKKFNILPTLSICLACKHCLPPNKRHGRMCKNEVTHEDKADDLILYCKLLKHLRTTAVTTKTSGKVYIFKKVYSSIVKDMCIPHVTRSLWTNELCFGLDYHPICGYNIIVPFKTLKNIKL